MHPLDVVKTRFQIQTTGKPGDPNYYTSVYDCMRKMARNEGVLSLYKGVLPPVLVETPKRAVKVRLAITPNLTLSLVLSLSPRQVIRDQSLLPPVFVCLSYHSLHSIGNMNA